MTKLATCRSAAEFWIESTLFVMFVAMEGDYSSCAISLLQIFAEEVPAGVLLRRSSSDDSHDELNDAHSSSLRLVM